MSVAAASAPVPSPVRSYVHACREEINQGVQVAVGYERRAMLYTALAVSSFVVIALLVGGAGIYFASQSSIYMPMIMLGTAGLIVQWGGGAYEYFHDFSANYTRRAQQTRDLFREYDPIRVGTPDGVYAQISALRINSSALTDLTPQTVEPYKPLLASYKYWERRHNHYTTCYNEAIAKARRIPENQAPAIVEAYNQAGREEHSVFITKVNTAFARAVINNIRFNGNFDTIVTRHDLHVSLYQQYNACGDRRADNFITFRNGLPPITVEQMRTQSIDQLAQRLLGAMG